MTAIIADLVISQLIFINTISIYLLFFNTIFRFTIKKHILISFIVGLNQALHIHNAYLS